MSTVPYPRISLATAVIDILVGPITGLDPQNTGIASQWKSRLHDKASRKTCEDSFAPKKHRLSS